MQLRMWHTGLAAVESVKRSFAMRVRWLVPVLKYAVLVLMVIAVARPQLGTLQTTVKTKGVNIVLAVDLSESMAALDFKENGETVNRLTAVKGVIRDFIPTRENDRIGMVVFGSHAYTQLPLTRDYNAVSTVLEDLEIGAAGKSTAIGDAMGISLKRLADIPSRSNIIILLTDGRSNSGEVSPDTAARIAVERNVKIYTIGVGTRGRVPFLINDRVFGQRYVYQRVDIDEETLQSIADQTGGLYFRAENVEGLRKIYDTIGEMEKSEVKMKQFAVYDELYMYFLWAAFALLGLWVTLINTRYLRLP